MGAHVSCFHARVSQLRRSKTARQDSKRPIGFCLYANRSIALFSKPCLSCSVAAAEMAIGGCVTCSAVFFFLLPSYQFCLSLSLSRHAQPKASDGNDKSPVYQYRAFRPAGIPAVRFAPFHRDNGLDLYPINRILFFLHYFLFYPIQPNDGSREGIPMERTPHQRSTRAQGGESSAAIIIITGCHWGRQKKPIDWLQLACHHHRYNMLGRLGFRRMRAMAAESASDGARTVSLSLSD